MKKNTLLLILAIVGLFLAAAPAGAETFTGGPITLEVPKGWTAEYHKMGTTDQIRLMAAGNQCRVAVLLGPSIGRETKKDAELLAQNLGETTTPEPVPGPDSYHFFARNQKQAKLEAIVFTRYPAMFTWMQSGLTEKYTEDIRTIWNSLSSTNPFHQALIDELYKL